MVAIEPMPEITDMILEMGGETLKICMQCGTCSGVCPWGLVKEFSPRLLIRLVSMGMEGYEEDTLWNCVTCKTCVDRCPRGIDIIDVMRATRAVMIESGMVPSLYRAPLASLRDNGNPWGNERTERMDWAKDLQVPEFTENTENLFFACCTHAYDSRNKKALKKMVSLLIKGGVDFGVIGAKESCCGDQPHNCGDFEVYKKLQRSNSELFKSKGVRQIIASSPHCMNTFNKDYENLETVHYTQIFDRLIQQGKLKPSKEVPMKVSYHDPCYLGRHNGVYEAPRRVLQSVPGLTYIEFSRNRSKGLCCGGGGGGSWKEVPAEQRFSVLRIKEARELGAEVIATACPYCMLMLEDGLKAMGIEEEFKILDIAEILFDSVE